MQPTTGTRRPASSLPGGSPHAAPRPAASDAQAPEAPDAGADGTVTLHLARDLSPPLTRDGLAYPPGQWARPIDPQLARAHNRSRDQDRYPVSRTPPTPLTPPWPPLRDRACRALGRACIALGFGGFVGAVVAFGTAIGLHDEGQDNASAFGLAGAAGGAALFVCSALACWLQRGDECGPEAAED